ncbi:NUDIX domain-containing protein [Paenibacillus sp. GCM10028914]|uniref:NUDIX domain-containing protein n=1 Tax=Paenibacillus sp. GCM10028914 TaxID=3273416 RepID=UPI00362402A4
MNTRLMSTAFLYYNDKILMMKRSANRKLAPGLWTGIGGHIEPDEMNNPELACIREIYEETGIESDRLSDSIRDSKIIIKRSHPHHTTNPVRLSPLGAVA